eukprot:gene11828-24800_t
MVPETVTILKEWPLNSNGKVDRKILPEPELLCDDNVTFNVTSYTILKQRIALLYSSVLGHTEESLNPEETFNSLGGHSLLAIAVVSQIRKEFKIQLSLNEFLVNSSIFALAKHLQVENETFYENEKVIIDFIMKIPLIFPSWWWIAELLIVFVLMLLEALTVGTACWMALMTMMAVPFHSSPSSNEYHIFYYYISTVCFVCFTAVIKLIVWAILARLTDPYIVPGNYSRFSFAYLLSNFMQRINSINLYALKPFTGTPFLNWYLRQLGADIGHRSYLYSLECDHWCLVNIGDDACIQPGIQLQTTCFLLPIIGQVTIEDYAVVAPLSHCSGRESSLTVFDLSQWDSLERRPSWQLEMQIILFLLLKIYHVPIVFVLLAMRSLTNYQPILLLPWTMFLYRIAMSSHTSASSVPVGSWTYTVNYWLSLIYLHQCPALVLRVVFGLDIADNSFFLSRLSSIELPFSHLSIGSQTLITSDVIIGAADIVQGQWMLHKLVIRVNLYIGNRSVFALMQEYLLAASSEACLKLSTKFGGYETALAGSMSGISLSSLRFVVSAIMLNFLSDIILASSVVISIIVVISGMLGYHDNSFSWPKLSPNGVISSSIVDIRQEWKTSHKSLDSP